MGWVTSVERKEGAGKIQPTQFVAFVKVISADGGTSITQIDTYGSDDRKNPGKQSQTLQFGRQSAEQLYKILKDTYGF